MLMHRLLNSTVQTKKHKHHLCLTEVPSLDTNICQSFGFAR